MRTIKNIWINLLLFVLTICICILIFEAILRCLNISCSIRDVNGETPFIMSNNTYYIEPNYSGREKCLEFDVKIRTNSEGYRDSEFNSTNRVVLLFGDSFAFGEGVHQDEMFAEVLEKVFLKDVAVYNLAVVGYSPKEYIKQYDKYADKFTPELVIVALYEGNDVQEDCGLINRADFIGNKRNGFGKIKDFAKKLYVVRFIDPLLKNLIDLGDSSMTSKQFYLLNESETVKKCNDILKSNIKTLRDKTYADNRKIVFVILPSKANFMDFDSPVIDYNKKLKKMLEFCSDLDLICLNVKDYIDNPKEWYLKEGHLNAKGHYKIAEVISGFITEQELLKY